MLRLRPLRPEDEAAFRAGHEAMAAEGFVFGLGFEPAMAFGAYLELVHGWPLRASLPDRWVPNTFLVAEVAGTLVGRTSIRHELNEFLAREGGHIGYAVLAAHRRRGYATEILRQSLVIARSVGVDRVLITCDDDNVGSIKVIESCGGRLEDVIAVSDKGAPGVRRYWID
jgi:predicted acetyltransferase